MGKDGEPDFQEEMDNDGWIRLDVDIQDPVEDYGQDCNFMLKIGKKSQEC
jgi:hypothetical protein